ncbi:SixA phosphatase family protein [Olivibacter sitiensis]|uniref:SixA phosphatase family protein n=1 Tax=Olivibacter sitiensis TaxID=376470 RepID=UPI0003F8D5B7|nr:histidine phosphatase family protein [Olivibacter sitiensis]
MSKELFLIRHAKSDWSFDLTDVERPLNYRGNRDAPVMAKRLKEYGILPQLIITSNALRTKETAAYFVDKLALQEDKVIEDAHIYEAHYETLLMVINDFDNQYDRIAIIGHNPGISVINSYLSGDNSFAFPTCGIVHLHFDVDNWQEISQGSGNIKWIDYPKNK